MPELPEVETIKRFLEATVVNQKIVSLDILTPKSFVGNPELVEGQKIIKFTRLGKQLSAHLSNNLILLFHLKMTGQLIYNPPLSRGGPEGGGVLFGHPTKTINPKSTRLIFHFQNSTTLFFNDQRKFGWVKLLSKDELVEFQHNLGIDVLHPEFTFNSFQLALQRTKAPIKSVLLNQSLFAGIGNIYANDALYLAKIHPKIPANQIQRTRALALHKSILSVINQSILAGGSTAKDQSYLRPDGTPGKNQFFFRVYQKNGEPCSVCHTPIKRLKLAGRGTFFCPKCQKL